MCCAAYVFVTDFWQFMAVTLCAVACARPGLPVLQALVAVPCRSARSAPRLLAVVNVVRNCGLGIGAMAAGVALTDDIPAAHRVTLVTIGLASSAVRYSCCGCPNSPRRRPRRQPRRPGGRGAAEWSDTSRMLPDARYLTLTGLNFLLFSFDTRLLVVVLQIPVSELATGRRRTTRMLTWTGAMPAVSSLCFAASGSLAGGPARAWLTAALVTLSLAELTANSAVWGLSIALAPEERRGCCLAVFDLSVAGQGVLGGARPLPVFFSRRRWAAEMSTRICSTCFAMTHHVECVAILEPAGKGS